MEIYFFVNSLIKFCKEILPRIPLTALFFFEIQGVLPFIVQREKKNVLNIIPVLLTEPLEFWI